MRACKSKPTGYIDKDKKKPIQRKSKDSFASAKINIIGLYINEDKSDCMNFDFEFIYI